MADLQFRTGHGPVKPQQNNGKNENQHVYGLYREMTQITAVLEHRMHEQCAR